MSTDRELLELAAKAAGIQYEWEQEGYAYGEIGIVPVDWRRCWNPKSEWTTDAFDLAVDLKLRIEHCDEVVYVGFSDDEDDIVSESISSDTSRADATRLAILRAAAEIGKAMK